MAGRDAGAMTGKGQLFRKQAVADADSAAFGSVLAVVPPSGVVGTALAIVCIVVLLAVACLVRMPLKIEAAGVLMPPGGFVDVIAVADGRIDKVHRPASTIVDAGEPLFDIVVHSTVVEGAVSSRFRLHSVRREADQLRHIRRARDSVFEEQLDGLQQELNATGERRRLLDRQVAAQKESLAAAEVRLDRHRALVDAGHLPRDELDRQREFLLRERAVLAGTEQQGAALTVAQQSLLTRIGTLRGEREVTRAEIDMRLEQLSRTVEATASKTHYSVRSPRDGLIESLLVEPGSFVRKGQVLARLSRGPGRLEAWLYLPSSSARSLSPGQSVELRLDAWPRAVFGARTATVYFVSAIPISPENVSAPLSVAVPVFEIRARLDRQPVPAVTGGWAIPPGTTFRAYVLQRPMRLYEWLFRNRRPQSNDHHA